MQITSDTRRALRRSMIGSALGLSALANPTPAHARPTGPERMCEVYPESPDCSGRLVTCATCHDSTDPPSWNAYGASVMAALHDGASGGDFDQQLGAALRAIELEDADGDGVPNLDELQLGTNPGNPDSLWSPPKPPTADDNPWYRLGGYDAAFALQRVSVLYCGHSASFETRTELAALDVDAQREQVHSVLSACLDSEYWRHAGLSRLADRRIRPVLALGPDSQVQLGPARSVLADYEWDYRLWRYVLTDDRDMRELLTAQYHVVDDGSGGLMPVEGAIMPDIEIAPGFFNGGQPLAPEHRAGMITTQWFIVLNTMFSGLPRTTAAQAYRSYLGMDLSRDEGILPVPGEPVDIDNKGVAAPACAQCHTTLDPLAYAFAYYVGLESMLPGSGGTYLPERPMNMIEGWDPQQQRSVVLGQPVDDVVQWAAVAAESPNFRRTMAETFLSHALDRHLGPGEYAELAELTDSLLTDGYSANRLIHRIVDTDAFGAP